MVLMLCASVLVHADGGVVLSYRVAVDGWANIFLCVCMIDQTIRTAHFFALPFPATVDGGDCLYMYGDDA